MRLTATLSLAAAFALTALGQSAPPAKFDAVSIKPAAPQPAGRIMIGLHTDPGRLTITNMSLRDMIQAAYTLKPYQLVGPDWMNDQRFDVSAETTAPLTREQMLKLLQPYLEQQFKLVTHRDTKIVPIYALVDDGAKAKLKAPAEGGPPNGAFMMRMSPQGMHFQGASDMDGLANILSRQEDRPVINQTGITGVYQIELDFAPTGNGMIMRGPKGADLPPDGMRADRGGDSPDAAPPAPNLFTAVQEQLGLKLEAKKGPVEIMVIDSASKSPIGN
ncbi:MAG TPA: TIGR03435 family protein [Terriglobales bacterium]|nr:TIGR03435 family protein [Terriglobales bacterium]